MTASAHLSFYALDRIRLGEAPGPGEGEHLSVCPTCAGRARASAGPTIPLPPWLAEVRLAAGSASNRTAGWRARWPLWVTASALAVAAGSFLIMPRGLRDDQPADTRAKGSPAVQIFVKRGERVFPWEGRPIRAGDRLRVEVNGGGFGFVSVAGHGPAPSPPVLLYQGALAAGAQLLPLSFRVDPDGKQEILSVIFGRRPVPAHLHARADDPPPEEVDTWRQIVVLDKEVPR